MELLQIIPEKVKECDRRLRQKDEKMIALETENAMLYLRIAQLQGELASSHKAMAFMKQAIEAEDDLQLSIGPACFHVHRKVQEVKRDLQHLRDLVGSMPIQLPLDAGLLQDKAASLCRSLISDNVDMQDLKERLAVLQEQLKTLEQQYTKEKRRRKELHNALVELHGNIRVQCRSRPIMSHDPASGALAEKVVHIIDDENLVVAYNKPGMGAVQKTFEFERVYSTTDNQSDVYDEVKPLLTSLLDGFNVCIMAYGQTGSGKTYTMLGENYMDLNREVDGELDIHPSDGLVPRAALELFKLIRERPSVSHSIEVSVVEIYNNDIRDLLEADAGLVKLNLRTCDDGSMEIPSLTQRQVESATEIVQLVEYGMLHRHEDATLIHAHSSRSHLVVTLTVSIYPEAAPTTTPITSRSASPAHDLLSPRDIPAKSLKRNLSIPTLSLHSLTQSAAKSPLTVRSASSTPVFFPITQPGVVKTKLQLVDLAGSECVGMSGVTGAALRETSHINRSLSALSDVLTALAEGRSHIPYRNSRLTHLLQDSIGGDAKLLVLCCVSPTQAFVTETLQCLGFGSRARQVQRGPTKKRGTAGSNPSGGPSSSGFSHFRSMPNLDTEHRSPRPQRHPFNRSASLHK